MRANLHVTSKCLGNGTSASVYSATLDGVIPVAAKVGNVRDDSRRQIRREARRYSKLIHPNIIKCFAVTETPSSVLLITEYMAGGSLFHNLSSRHNAIPISSALQISIYIVRALHHIHEQGFSCGDVKSLNILLSHKLRPDGYLDAGCSVKLCDFGLSKRLYHDYDADGKSLNSSSLDLWNSTAFDPEAKNIAGTFAYLAPECFEKPPNTPSGMIAADIYALGVVLWELITCKIPWDRLSIGGLMKMMRENRKLQFEHKAHREFAGGNLVDLVHRCWDNNPEKRPRTLEILHTLQHIYQTAEEINLSLVDSPTNVMQHAANVAYEREKNKANNNNNDSANTLNRRDSLTSDESAAIASINSDDEEDYFDADSAAFDVSVSVYPAFENEINRRKNLHALRKARDEDYTSSPSSSYYDDVQGNNNNNVYEEEEVTAVFGQVDDIVVFDNPNKKKTFYKKEKKKKNIIYDERITSYNRVPTIREIPSEYQLPDTDKDCTKFNNDYDRVPTIREIQSEAILPGAGSDRDSDSDDGTETSGYYSSDGSNYSSSVGDEDDINIGVQVEEEEEVILDDNVYKRNKNNHVDGAFNGNMGKGTPSYVADPAAHGSLSSAGIGSSVRRGENNNNNNISNKQNRPPVHPIIPIHSKKYIPKKKRMPNNKGDNNNNGCFMPEEFPASGPGWLEATNELSEHSYTFQDKSIDGSILPPSFVVVDLPRKPPQQQQNNNNNIQQNSKQDTTTITTTHAQRSASAPLSDLQTKKNITTTNTSQRPASEQNNNKQREVRRFYSATTTASPAQVRRQYNVTPAAASENNNDTSLALEDEVLEMFEDLDANPDVLGSVMQFSKFVQRNKT